MFHAFFGRSPEDMSAKVVLTNIGPMFDGLAEIDGAHTRTRGFYEVADSGTEDGEIFTVIKLPPGNSFRDPALLFRTMETKLFFFGIAGTLDTAYPIGSVVAPRFCKKDGLETKRLNTKGDAAIIHQTSGLIQRDTYYKSLILSGVSLVDMECWDFAALCQETRMDYCYAVQVSDAPLEEPFYVATPRAIDVRAFLKYIVR